MDNGIRLLSGGISILIVGGFILFIGVPFVWNLIRFIIEIFKKWAQKSHIFDKVWGVVFYFTKKQKQTFYVKYIDNDFWGWYNANCLLKSLYGTSGYYGFTELDKSFC